MNIRILDGSIIILYLYNPSVLFYFNLADSFIFCLLVSYQHKKFVIITRQLNLQRKTINKAKKHVSSL